MDYIICSVEEFDTLYGGPHERSVLKVNDFLDENSRHFIEAAPFAVLAASDEQGNLGCSSRGGFAEFVRVLDEKTLLLTDRRGNNRTESLKNAIENPRVLLLFFVPNIGGTFRARHGANLRSARFASRICGRRKNAENGFNRSRAQGFCALVARSSVPNYGSLKNILSRRTCRRWERL